MTNKKVIITKGEHLGVIAYVVKTRTEYIGGSKVFKLQTKGGEQLWNGSYTWFPESFVIDFN